jgi:hypothetical protein
LGLPRVYGDRANGKELSRHGPAQMASQHYRRLLGATSWGPQTWLWWFAQEAVKAFPAPEDGVLSLVGDRTLKGKRGAKPPVAQKTRLRHVPPSVFGFRIVVLMAQWDVYRIPGDVALRRRKEEAPSQTANALFRQMLRDFRPPLWCQEGVVVAAAASASRPNLALIQERR